MKITKVSLKLTELKKALSQDELLAFVCFSRVLNEIWILGSMCFMMRKKPKDKIEHYIKDTQFFLFLTLLTGKLNEVWQLLHKLFYKSPSGCSTPLSQRFNKKCEKMQWPQELMKQKQEAEASLKEIKKFFGKNNLINKIRNGSAFHYNNLDEIIKITEKISKESPDWNFELFLSSTYGNFLHQGANFLFKGAVIFQINSDEQSISKTWKRIGEEVQNINEHFIVFLNFYLVFLLEKCNSVNQELEEIEVEAAKRSESFIPYFFENPLAERDNLELEDD